MTAPLVAILRIGTGIWHEREDQRIQLAFELEEYKQVLEERRFVVTRFVQAVGLYLALSGFALKELVEIKSVFLTSALFVFLSILNGVAFQVANRFRNMAAHTMQRETYLVTRYGVAQMYVLFWGYYAALWLVSTAELAFGVVLVWRIAFSLL